MYQTSVSTPWIQYAICQPALPLLGFVWSAAGNVQKRSISIMCLIKFLVMLRFGFIDFDRFRFDFSINNSISIRFSFDFFTICTPLLTQLNSCVAAWERQCSGAGHPRSYPPTAAVVVGWNREDVEWAKYRSNIVALWHRAEAAKLDSATANTNYPLFDVQFSYMCPMCEPALL